MNGTPRKPSAAPQQPAAPSSEGAREIPLSKLTIRTSTGMTISGTDIALLIDYAKNVLDDQHARLAKAVDPADAVNLLLNVAVVLDEHVGDSRDVPCTTAWVLACVIRDIYARTITKLEPGPEYIAVVPPIEAAEGGAE
jgi:hypothetical protein